MRGEDKKEAQLGKADRKPRSLAEQHSKLYLQSKSEATATKQMGKQLQSSQGPQSSMFDGLPSSSVHRNKAVEFTATEQILRSCARYYLNKKGMHCIRKS